MQEEALQQFLSSVRCERFIDYLDPIGETAEEALARRVRWARMTRNDPAHADEAMFLLQHEGELRHVLTRELDAEDSWVEGVSAGQEFGGTHWAREGETTRLEAHEPSPGTGTLDPEATDDDSDEEPLTDGPVTGTGIMRMEDITLDDPWAESSPELAATPVNAGAKVTRELTTLDSLPAATVQPGLVQTRGKVRTASPAVRRVSSPTLSTTLDMPTIPPLDELELRRQAAVRADNEATDPSARPTPELARAIAQAAATGNTPAPAPAPDLRATDPAVPTRVVASPPPAPTKEESSGFPLVPVAVGALGVALLIGGFAMFRPEATPPSPAPSPVLADAKRAPIAAPAPAAVPAPVAAPVADAA
ncbi:MAG: hypothetical protein KC656_02995, partial [Myxococcales bacterium]|nr:hypothetical protein [Myxococcales bacterium]